MNALKKEKNFLEGEKVALRDFKLSDGKLLKLWLSNKKVNYFLEMGFRPFRDKEVRAFQKRAMNSENDIIFTILKKENRKVIGSCGLYDIDFISKRGQLNIIIGDDQSHNDGYGTDTVKILIKYGFERLGLNSIQLGVNAENIKGLKAYKKAGFKKEGQRRQYIYTNNKFNDMIVMSILASEYK